MADRRKPRSRDSENKPPGEVSPSENLSVWVPSPELVKAIQRESERPGPGPSQPAPPPLSGLPSLRLPSLEIEETQRGSRRSEPPLPKVTGLPDLSHADVPDEQGVTRLRPGLQPPLEPAEEDTLLYVRHVPSSAPAPRLAPSTPPSPTRRPESRAFRILVMMSLLLALVGLAYATLRRLSP
jgi:hypothetical protein